MNEPLLSIVIPTKDRYNYLKCLLELIYGFKSELIEVVLQDNTSNNEEIIKFLEERNYPNLVYNHIPHQIPISLNCDKAIKNSHGKYVCFIGDDDGVTRYIVDCVRWMDNNDIEIVLPETISYYWPDAVYTVSGNVPGRLIIPKFSNKVTKISTRLVLEEIMNLGFINRGRLPLAYHGIVRRDTLEKIFQICGTYFPGQSPDIANGVALSLVSDHYYHISFPLVIPGAGSRHGGDIGKMKNHAAKIEDVPFLSNTAKRDWEELIPRIWTGETIWCESAVKALRNMQHSEMVKNVNFEVMYAYFIAYHYPLRNMAYKLTSNKFKLFIKSNLLFVERVINAIARRLKMRFVKDSNQIFGVNTINDAEEILCRNHREFISCENIEHND